MIRYLQKVIRMSEVRTMPTDEDVEDFFAAEILYIVGFLMGLTCGG